MRKLFGVTAALVMVAGTAGGQASVDYANRSISVSGSASNPSHPHVSLSGEIQGTIDTHLLDPAQVSTLIFYIGRPNVQVAISGFDDPSACCEAAASAVWLNGHEDQIQLENTGAYNSDGNQFTLGPGGYSMIFSDFLYHPGDPTAPYDLSAGVFLSVMGQGLAANATGSASVTLLGVDAVSADGTVVESANFDQFGNGAFGYNLASTEPEPTSLALLASGLFALAPFVRRPRIA